MSGNSSRRKRRKQAGSSLNDIELTQGQTLSEASDDIYGTSRKGALSRGLRATESGELTYGPVKLTSVGILWPENRQITEQDFEGLGRVLLQMEGSIGWLIGDWLAYAENNGLGDKAQELAEEFGRSEGSFRVYKSVAKSVTALIRIKELSFGHHQIVAHLNPDDQRYWLERAAEEGMSIASLRHAMKEAQEQVEAAVTTEKLAAQSFKRLMTDFAKYKRGNLTGKARQSALDRVEALRRWLDEVEQQFKS